MRLELVALAPECAECEIPWLPADEEHWRAYLTGDETSRPSSRSTASVAEREFAD